MAVSQIVDSDALYPCGIGPSVHFMMKVALGYHEHTVMFSDTVELTDEVLHLLRKKIRHLHNTVALGGFRIGDNILPLDTLIGLCDRDRLLLKVEIGRREGEKFTLTDTAPVQHFKGIERNRLVHHHLCELLVFLLRPEQNLPVLRFSHIACLGCGIARKPVELYCIVEHSTELIVKRFQIHR